MQTEPFFWVVWAENGGSPTVKHPTRERASEEARRLARANPGVRFVVLQPVQAVVKNDLITTTFHPRIELPDDADDWEVPF